MDRRTRPKAPAPPPPVPASRPLGSVKAARERMAAAGLLDPTQSESDTIPYARTQRPPPPRTPSARATAYTPGVQPISGPPSKTAPIPPSHFNALGNSFQAPSATHPPPNQAIPSASQWPLIDVASSTSSASASRSAAAPHPTSLAPTTGWSTSRPSTGSSFESIPDFPAPSNSSGSVALQPAQAAQARRTPSTGPPPSSRRGASSYYSQNSFVEPILEERHDSALGNHKTLAVPACPGWPGATPIRSSAFYAEGDDPDEEDFDADDRHHASGLDDDDTTGLVRQASFGKRHKPSLTVVRSSSSSSNEGARRKRIQQRQEERLGGATPAAAVTAADPAARAGTAAAVGIGAGVAAAALPRIMRTDEKGHDYAQPYTPQSQRTFDANDSFLDPPSTSSTQNTPTTKDAKASNALAANVMPSNAMGSKTLPGSGRSSRCAEHAHDSDVDPRVTQILGGLEKGGAIQAGTAPPSIDTSRAASPIPRRLKTDSRSSMTSLTDLIKRATRVAANLDRGKTASRLGILDFFGTPEAAEKIAHAKKGHTSYSQMLAAFPHPGTGSPDGSVRRQPGSPWGSYPNSKAQSRLNVAELADYNDGDDAEKSHFGHSDGPKPLCGMRRSACWLVTLAMLVLVLAAIMVPIGLFVIAPRSQSNSGCAFTNPCDNGGYAVSVSGNCQCICVKGYTGPSCDAGGPSASGARSDVCTSTNLPAMPNVSSGTSIPPLLAAAGTNFSVPLNSTAILAIFASANLTCADENNLVTFTPPARQTRPRILKRSQLALQPHVVLNLAATPTIPFEPAQAALPSKSPQQANELEPSEPNKALNKQKLDKRTNPSLVPTTPAFDAVAAVTSNGIVMAAPSSSSTPPPSSTTVSLSSMSATASSANHPSSTVSSPASTPSSGSGSGSGSGLGNLSNSNGTASTAVLDFARVAVLYVLQQTGQLNTAVNARGQLQAALGATPFNATTVKVGELVSVDLGAGTIRVGNLTAGIGRS